RLAGLPDPPGLEANRFHRLVERLEVAPRTLVTAIRVGLGRELRRDDCFEIGVHGREHALNFPAVERLDHVAHGIDVGARHSPSIPLLQRAKENQVQITRNSTQTNRGPDVWFTGGVYIDPVAAPLEPSRVQAVSVHFTPRARTAWHTHPNGQTIFVTEGVGRAQRRGGPIEVIRPGDRVFFEPGEDHWHGAAPDRFMTHLAMLEVDDEGSNATWGDHVTDDEYGAAPA